MTVSNQLNELVEKARKDGWADGVCSTETLEYQTWGRAYTTVAGRSLKGGFEVLRPTGTDQAEKRSLSAVYGRGQQPLHTDGAHLAEPPDLVILAVAKPTPVPTLLWRHIDMVEGLSELDEDIRHGLFTIDDGKEVHLAPARTGWTKETARIRFDPGCMEPADSRARRVLKHFETALKSATQFEWTKPDQVLVIDNRNVLHARADSEHDPDREMQRLMLRLNQKSSS